MNREDSQWVTWREAGGAGSQDAAAVATAWNPTVGVKINWAAMPELGEVPDEVRDAVEARLQTILSQLYTISFISGIKNIKNVR